MLGAARDLVLEHGYDTVSLVQIAATAGVGRQTIYRWWRTKEAVVAEAVLTENIPLDQMVVADSGDLAVDLHRWVDDSIRRIADSNSASLYRALLAASAVDADAASRMSDAFAAPLRAAVRAAFISAGREKDADVAADILIGIMLHAIISPDPAVRDRIPQVVDVMTRGAATEQAPYGG